MRKILVTGATGFLGKRVCHKLAERGENFTRTSLSLGTDLRDQKATLDLFNSVKPDIVLHCAAYVGGIQFGYKYPADLFTDNMRMSLNLYEAANQAGVLRIINPISNCVYPARASYFQEDELWDGPLHESVLAYGFSRKASWVGAWAFNQQYGLNTINIILSNMYGPEDHFEAERSHALGALIMKFVDAAHYNRDQVTVWGTGDPVREWLHIDDGAEAVIRAIDAPETIEPINIGVGKGISIAALVNLIKDCSGYEGEIVFDSSKPDGAPYKTVDGTRGAALLNWKPQVTLEDGVHSTVAWYVANRG